MVCGECTAHHEVYQGFHDEPITVCPGCSADALTRVLFPPTVIDATPKTLGSLAEKNSGPGRHYWVDRQRHDLAASRQRGRDEINASLPAGMESARPEKPEKPWFRGETVDTSLAVLTPRQQADYILTGKTSG